MTIHEYFQYYKKESKKATYPDNNQELWNIHTKMMEYCKFNINSIAPYIEELIKEVEKKEYKIKIKRHPYKQKNMKFNNFDGSVMRIENGICDTAFIHPINMNEEEIESALYYLDKNKISIISNSTVNKFNINDGTFYAFNDAKNINGYECTLQCDRFPYIKIFLEKLINRKIENQNTKLSIYEIKTILSETIELAKILNNTKIR